MKRTRTGDSPRDVAAPDFGHMSAGFEALTSALWREREIMENLLFALTAQQLLLESGQLRWLATSSTQIADLVDALRQQELLRAIVTEELTLELGLSSPVSSKDLAASAPDAYAAIFEDLAAALGGLTTEIDIAVRHNDDLLLATVRPDGGSCVGGPS